MLEQIIGEAPLLAPLELLAYAAACTDRLRLGWPCWSRRCTSRSSWPRR
ncbi:hypothetical protein I552_8691 [Mycobacterium xenopi 3993]|nr:hypothetical protein I552_8691 [Mycobacterium xenopi 3993]